jgi:hypothetical protein
MKYSPKEINSGMKEHLKYELDMFRYAAIKLFDLQQESQDPSLFKNTILESFLIHTRNLRDFLCLKKPKYPDQIIAGDYIGDRQQWQNKRYKMSYLENGKTIAKINKLLAHISTDRAKFISEEGASWDITKIEEEIYNGWKVFVESLNSQHGIGFPIYNKSKAHTEIVANTSSVISITTSRQN